MKAFKIDTGARTVEVVDIPTWKDIAPTIGNGCTTFAIPVTFDNGDAFVCDDEGMFNNFEGGFMMEDWDYPIVGNALLQGTDDEGNTVEPKTTKEELETMIGWVSKADCDRWAEQFK